MTSLAMSAQADGSRDVAPVSAFSGNASAAPRKPSSPFSNGGGGAAAATVGVGNPHNNPDGVGVDRGGSQAAAVPGDDGMRREWNFALSFHHRAARMVLQCSPHWEPTFIDPETIEKVAELDRDVARCPLMPVIRYTDLSAVVTTTGNGNLHSNGNALGARGSIDSVTPHETWHSNANSPSEREHNSVSLGTAHAESDAGDLWVEKAKHVEGWYAHLAPGTTLASFCRACVQHVLKDPLVVSIDGDSNVTKLRMGRKLASPSLLGGHHRSFHFRFRLHDRSQLMNDAAYAVGTVVHQRGYLFLVRCSEEEELEGYLRRLFLPFYTNPTKLGLDVDVAYNPTASVMMAEQQELHGEMLYEDRDAAVAFSLPMYPMRFRPDFSPAKTVGVGSIACMTLELGVFERVFEDAAVAEVAGMPKYKVNQVVLCLDVEDVARMGYPNVLSTDQYSELKIKRLLEVFPDANLVSQQPTTVMLGGRAGRGYTATFSYEPLQCIAKAMLVTTLIDGSGVTALYLTRLGGGIFDAYLYLYEQLLGGTRFLPHSSQQASLRLSRHRAPNVRLLDTDLAAAYAAGGLPAAMPTPAPAASGDSGSPEEGAHSTEQDVGEAEGPAPPQEATQEGSQEREEVEEHAAAAATTAAVMSALYGQGRRNKVMERHLRLMREAANDGRVPEGAAVLQVAPEYGGLPRHRANSATAAAAATSAPPLRRTTARQTPATMAAGPAPGVAGGRGDVPNSSTVGSDARRATRDSHPPPLSSSAANSTLGGGAGDAGTGPDSSLFNGSATGSMGNTLFVGSGVGDVASGGGLAAVAMADYFGNEDARPSLAVFSGGGAGMSAAVAPARRGSAVAALTGAEAQGGGAVDLTEVSLHSESLISVSGIPRLEEAQRQAEALAAEAASTARGEDRSESPVAETAVGAGFSRRSSAASAVSASRGGADGVSGGRREERDSTSFAADSFREPDAAGMPSEQPFFSASAPPCRRRASSTEARRRGSGGGDDDGEEREDSEVARGDEADAAEQQAVERRMRAAAAAVEEARIQSILNEGQPDGETATTRKTYLVGPSLRDVYIRCCDLQCCKPNSYLLKRLPTDPRFTSSVEEIDLTSNYLGRNGFVAILNLLEHLPRLQRVFFNDMALDNVDVEHLCEALARHPTITSVEVKNNVKVTLPATRFFTRLLRANPRIRRLCLSGTRIGESVVAKLEHEAAQGPSRQAAPPTPPPRQTEGEETATDGG